MEYELRCGEGKLYGVVVDDHTVEVKCNSRFCGSRPGVVVLHRFDLRTGGRTTKMFMEPSRREVRE